MDVFEAIRTMLAVRTYQDKPVPEATLRRVIEAGRLTGSAKNVQPWHFVVVQERETLRQLGKLARTGAHTAQAAAAIEAIRIDFEFLRVDHGGGGAVSASRLQDHVQPFAWPSAFARMTFFQVTRGLAP